MCSKHMILLLCFMSSYSLADSEGASLTCKEVAQADAKYVILSGSDMGFQIQSPRRACNSVFTYEAIMLPKERLMITSWPIDHELGINAQRDLFIASTNRSKARYIGSIPVDATAITAGEYRSIAQSGGSIYETVYILNEESIKIKSPSRELVFSDTVCVYKEQNGDVCQAVTGTFDDPLCVYVYNEKKILMTLFDCSELLHDK